MTKRTILLSVFLLALAAAVAIYFLVYNKPHKDAADLKPDHVIEATELYAQYSSNEADADALYLGKMIEVTGTLEKISTDEAGVTSLFLSADSEMDNVICELDEIYKKEVPDLKEGDTVKVRGWCSGSMGDVILSRCVIID